MKLIAALCLSGLAQAAYHHAENGIHYSVALTQNGVEIPFTPGPQPGPQANSQVAQHNAAMTRNRAKRQSKKRQAISTTSNWCGMVNSAPPSGVWNNVWGAWVVPQISLRSGQTASQQPSVAEWVGIDGDVQCNGGLIQGGTISYIDDNGAQQNYAWWEFLPLAVQPINGLTVNVGDTIYGNVTMTGTKSGVVEIINASSGLAVVVTITDYEDGIALCGYQADWIFEDLSCCGGLAPFAEFPDTFFFDGYSITTTGVNNGPTFGTDVYLAQNGQTLCKGYWDEGNQRIAIESTA